MPGRASALDSIDNRQTFWICKVLRNKLPKGPTCLLGRGPQGHWRSTVCLYYWMPMPLRASRCTQEHRCSIVFRVQHCFYIIECHCVADIAMPARTLASKRVRHNNECQSPGGLRLKRFVRPFRSFFPNTLPSQNVCRVYLH